MRNVQGARRTAPEELRLGAERVRIGPWRNNPEIGQITPVAGMAPPSPSAIQAAVACLRDRGCREVLTAAVGPYEQPAFERAGFTPREHLHLMGHDLERLEPPVLGSAGRPRRAHRSEWDDVVRLDAAAFAAFWHLDEAGLVDALVATPASRLRVVGTPPAGYAISGRAGNRGYLQRLAVHPDHQRRGIGRALALDGLRWMRRRGAVKAYVNTQVGNDAAVVLYLSLGFQFESGGLVVFGRSLERDAP